MENKITYLLGAGASYDALPIVEDFPKELQYVIQELLRSARNISYSDKKKFEMAIQDLSFLLKGCQEHQSIDTFARKFHLMKDNDNYRKTKKIIVLFFDLYYYFKKKVDKRYDAFLSSILNEEEPRFPNDINIISWNYDYEFEKAFQKYQRSGSTLEDSYEELNIIHKSKTKKELKHDYCKIVKINGTAGFFDNQDNIKLGLGCNALTAEDSSPYDPVRLLPLIDNHYNFQFGTKNDHEVAISFAWEKDESEIINRTLEILEESTKLVVIGYSFPFFNRKIDKQLLAFDNCPNLEEIFVQDLKPDEIIENIKKYRDISEWEDVEFYPLWNLKQFHIPF